MNCVFEVKNLAKWFLIKRGIISIFRPKQFIRAVDGISFDVKKKEMFGLVGESGCGKTTVGKLLLRLLEPTSGEIYFESRDISSFNTAELKRFRGNVQVIFQNPFGSLNPRMSIQDLLFEPLEFYNVGSSKAEKRGIIKEALETVQLTPVENFINRLPSKLSGGQLQRVTIARALLLQPKFIVADEPVSMLDVSIRGNILNLLLDLRKKFNLSGLFITHNLATARYMCHRVAVMYLGKIVEIGPTEEVVSQPLHPYTKALLAVVPVVEALSKPHRKVDQVIRGKIPPNAERLPTGCRFHPRCIFAQKICRQEQPELREITPNRQVACHLIN